ncbi:energy-coupling factor transporter transmembrane component T family protein [Desulfitobacterium sp. Sab5]|uniref:energy-coupling factor transporter transmembrane component T family protein n=1 Tax=Desulfitobacterium nosdiversum TaxID=3375356 RepID=UPI003CEFCED8
MKEIKLGQYFYGNSIIHLLDPRTKIICCILAFISVLINQKWYYLLFFVFLMITGTKCSGIGFKTIFQNLRSIRYLLLVTFAFQAILIKGEPVWHIGIFNVTDKGLILGMVNLLRLVILYLGSILLLMTTSPIQLAAGLEYLLLPLNGINIPVHSLSTILNISFRFIPTLIEEANNIKDAQISRGARFDCSKIIVNLKNYSAILIPLLASSLIRAENIAEAMDSRCYTGHPNRARMSSLHLTSIDITLICFMLIIFLVGVILCLS